VLSRHLAPPVGQAVSDERIRFGRSEVLDEAIDELRRAVTTPGTAYRRHGT